MFSVFRAIEAFGLRRQEKRLAQQLQKRRLEALPHVFGVSSSLLQEVFAGGTFNALRAASSPKGYLSNEHLGDLGLNAILQTQNVEINQFPQYVKAIESNREEVAPRHYEREGLHTFFAYDDEFGGRNMRLLTNDVELLKELAASRFHPPPPWIVWFDLGPYRAPSQGNPEHWFCHIWDPYWESLSLEEQDKFFEEWRPRTRTYISDEDWEEGWVPRVRMRDPRFHTREEQRGGE